MTKCQMAYYNQRLTDRFTLEIIILKEWSF